MTDSTHPPKSADADLLKFADLLEQRAGFYEDIAQRFNRELVSALRITARCAREAHAANTREPTPATGAHHEEEKP